MLEGAGYQFKTPKQFWGGFVTNAGDLSGLNNKSTPSRTISVPC